MYTEYMYMYKNNQFFQINSYSKSPPQKINNSIFYKQ